MNTKAPMKPKDYLKEPYSRVVIPEESGGYRAEILEFPGCFAEGDTVQKAYSELEGAAEDWIDAYLSEGKEVPPPFNNLSYSGTISLRLPRSIHKRAAIMAERDRVSLNSFLSTAIASRVGAEDFYGSLERRFVQAAMPFVYYFANVTAANTQREPTLHFQPTPQKIASTTDALPQLPALRR